MWCNILQVGKLPRDIAIEKGDTDFVEMIDDFENRLTSVQAVRTNPCNGNTSLSNIATPGGNVRDFLSIVLYSAYLRTDNLILTDTHNIFIPIMCNLQVKANTKSLINVYLLH